MISEFIEQKAKKLYIEPTIEIIVLNKENIIITSGATTVQAGLFGNGNGGVNVG